MCRSRVALCCKLSVQTPIAPAVLRWLAQRSRSDAVGMEEALATNCCSGVTRISLLTHPPLAPRSPQKGCIGFGALHLGAAGMPVRQIASR